MANLKKIFRTCIICRVKFEQKDLIRLKCKDKKLLKYDNYGRSFYICENCVSLLLDTQLKSKEYKKIEKKLNNECKANNNYITQLKEILTDVR